MSHGKAVVSISAGDEVSTRGENLSPFRMNKSYLLDLSRIHADATDGGTVTFRQKAETERLSECLTRSRLYLLIDCHFLRAVARG